MRQLATEKGTLVWCRSPRYGKRGCGTSIRVFELRTYRWASHRTMLTVSEEYVQIYISLCDGRPAVTAPTGALKKHTFERAERGRLFFAGPGCVN